MLHPVKNTRYKSDAGVLVMALEDMLAAGLIDLKRDKGATPNKEFIAPEVQASEVN